MDLKTYFVSEFYIWIDYCNANSEEEKVDFYMIFYFKDSLKLWLFRNLSIELFQVTKFIDQQKIYVLKRKVNYLEEAL